MCIVFYLLVQTSRRLKIKGNNRGELFLVPHHTEFRLCNDLVLGGVCLAKVLTTTMGCSCNLSSGDVLYANHQRRRELLCVPR
jgi:hypothetical protein